MSGAVIIAIFIAGSILWMWLVFELNVPANYGIPMLFLPLVVGAVALMLVHGSGCGGKNMESWDKQNMKELIGTTQVIFQKEEELRKEYEKALRLISDTEGTYSTTVAIMNSALDVFNGNARLIREYLNLLVEETPLEEEKLKGGDS